MRTPTKSPPELQTTTKLYDGQRHELIRTEPYTRLDGIETELFVWECHCPICSDTFAGGQQ
jgi:hypothetical protein